MELILAKELYIKTAISNIALGKFHVIDIVEISKSNLDEFNRFKVKIEEEIINLQKIVSEYLSNPELFIKFLIIDLNKKRKKKEPYNFLKNTILEVYYNKFSQQHQSLFDKAIQLIEHRIDYFCSYTTRGVPNINYSYAKAIRNQYGVDSRNEDWKSTNFLAKMIVRFYNDHGFNYFFDRDKIVNGDLIADQVYKYCNQTIVLIQILEQESFRDNANETNWCFNEFLEYKSAINIRYIFYKKEGLTRPQDVNEDIKQWYDFACTPQGVKSTTINFNWNEARIRNQVNIDAELVLQERTRLFEELFETI